MFQAVIVSGSPSQRQRKGGKTDQHHSAGPLQPCHCAGACQPATQARSQQGVSEDIDPAKPDKGHDHQQKLRDDRPRRIHKLRHKCNEEPYGFRVQQSNNETVPEGGAAGALAECL